MINIDSISPDRPVLIAGPTASGKSELALQIAEAQGGVVVNADALQVYEGWRVLTARPSAEDEARAKHVLYGHQAWETDYSVGHWLRDLAPLLPGERPIIVGGTGLYFAALTEGLADIPPVPNEVRAEADALPFDTLSRDLARADPVLYARIDQANRARVQRGWEVWRTTARPLSQWQADTGPPLLPLEACEALVLMPERDWLNARIARRFDLMLDQGALQEAETNLPRWDRAGGAAKAIGAPELIAYLQGIMTLEAAREAAIVASRQYAKRQRSWFRSRMKAWRQIPLP